MSALENHKLRKQYLNIFQSTFGISLDKFWTPMLGFDVIKFDTEFLIPKFKYENGKTSMNDCIRKEYGDIAVSRVKALL